MGKVVWQHREGHLVLTLQETVDWFQHVKKPVRFIIDFARISPNWGLVKSLSLQGFYLTGLVGR